MAGWRGAGGEDRYPTPNTSLPPAPPLPHLELEPGVAEGDLIAGLERLVVAGPLELRLALGADERTVAGAEVLDEPLARLVAPDLRVMTRDVVRFRQGRKV